MDSGSQKKGKDAHGKEVQKAPKFSENIVCQAVFDFADITVMVVRLTSDETFWIVGLRNGIIKLIPASGETPSNIQTLQVTDESSSCVDVKCVPHRPNEPSEKNHRLVAAYASGYVRIWYYTGATPESKLLSTMGEEFIPREEGNPKSATRKNKKMNQILACSCSLDGERFVTGGDDCFIRVYDINQKKVLRTLGSSFSVDKIDGHVMRICALQYHPRGGEFPEYKHVFISGGWDDTVQIWDDRFQHSLCVYN
ncbi:WD40 domain-containing protein [Fasciola gigantica]|uniref:WD40 domain-containing protein n=1 Tax=Fasciola gigantica TaxID=46835 RepID=A0A504YT54_FASGI|nr:WD40 domain-containing protein [Fasciola gigantica]